MIEFQPWGPDRSGHDPNFCDTIRNLVPRPAGYGPFNSFVSVSSSLPERPRGAILIRTDNGVFRTFVGTATEIFEYDGINRTWTPVNDPLVTYNLAAQTNWSFTQYGDYVIATNGIDPVQRLDTTAAAQFNDLAGDPPIASNCSVVGDFLVLGALQSDTRALAWSGLNNAEWWVYTERSSDYQPFPDGGKILGIGGFEKGGVVFQENAVREMSNALGTPYIFTFRKVDETRAMAAPHSIVQAGGRLFYLTEGGFFQYGEPPVNIGNELINRFFQADCSPQYLFEVQGAADPLQSIVYWRYRSAGHANLDTTDKVLIYNYEVGRWSYAEVELSWIFSASTPGVTLDQLHLLGYTLEDVPVSLDSRFWSGTEPAIAAINADFQLGFFSGVPLEALVQTPDLELTPGRRTAVTGLRVVTDSDRPTARVGGRDRHGGPLSWGPVNSMQGTGLIPARRSARVHRIEVAIPSGTERWEHLHGLDIEASPEGMR